MEEETSHLHEKSVTDEGNIKPSRQPLLSRGALLDKGGGKVTNKKRNGTEEVERGGPVR